MDGTATTRCALPRVVRTSSAHDARYQSLPIGADRRFLKHTLRSPFSTGITAPLRRLERQMGGLRRARTRLRMFSPFRRPRPGKATWLGGLEPDAPDRTEGIKPPSSCLLRPTSPTPPVRG